LSKRNKALAATLFALSLAGCSQADYFNHNDTVIVGAGNAMETNKGIHAIKPFPREAWDTRIGGDGERTYKTMTGYKGRPGGGSATATSSSSPSSKPLTPSASGSASASAGGSSTTSASPNTP